MNKILIVLILLHSTSAITQANFNQEIEVKLDSLIEETYDNNRPGGIITIIKNGDILYTKHKGLSSIEYNIPISDSTIFDIGSLSKQFTAFMTLLLEEKGKLDLEDNISIHLPELINLPHKISIKQLLNHTHGLPNSHELAELCGRKRMNHEETVNMLLKIKSANFKAGEKYEYNNTGYTLLAEIISRIEDKPFAKVLQDEIFEPLKMENTLVIDNPFQLIKNKAGSYNLATNEYRYLFNDKTSMGPGGICSNITDLTLWAKNFNHPTVGNSEMINKMKNPTVLNSGESIDYGYGIQLKTYKAKHVNFHGGADASYRSYLMNIPEDELSIIALSNDGGFSAIQLTHSIAEIVLDLKTQEDDSNFIPRGEEKPFEGTYEMFPGKYFNIISRSDSLFFQQYGYSFEIPLEHSNGTLYNIPILPYYSIEFKQDQFDFTIVDSKFRCEKIDLNPPTLSAADLNKFVGVYYNDDFGITYRIVSENDKLVANSNYDTYISLFPLNQSSFYSSYQYFGKLEFKQNSKGEYNSFLLSGSLINDIVFSKL